MKNQDLVAYILGGLGLEFDPVICNITSKKEDITLQDAQFLLMGYESRLEQYHASTTIDISQTPANLSAKSANFVRGGNQFQNNNRGRSRGRRGGRGDRYFYQRIVCQLCGKLGHFFSICYHRFDQTFAGIFGKQNQQSPQSVSTNYHMQGNFAQQQQIEYLGNPSYAHHYRSASTFTQSILVQESLSSSAAFHTAPQLQLLQPTTTSSHPMVTRSRNGIFRTKSFIGTIAAPAPIDVPSSVSAALSDFNWLAAMESEFSALKRNKT
ncbi:hypothetical protein ACOSQ4_014203 [Xanthoceras sorbifolium]